jgi:glycosyltransferase involved in cell wall biosynthesis
MADALGTLLDAPDRLSESRAAVPEYVARYGWERIAQEYASLYDEVARAA